MILHTLNAAPSSSAFEDCLSICQAGDAIVLMGDGVYAALEETTAYSALKSTGCALYMLAPDAGAAGVTPTTASVVVSIDMDGLVELTERYARQQAWY